MENINSPPAKEVTKSGIVVVNPDEVGKYKNKIIFSNAIDFPEPPKTEINARLKERLAKQKPSLSGVKLNALVRGNAWLEPQHAVQIPRNQKEWDIIKSIADLMSPAVVSGAGLVAMKAAERDVIGVTRTVFLKMLGATALAGGISVAGVNQLSFMTKGGTDEYAAAKSTLAQISSMRSIILLTDAKSTLHGDFKGPAIAVSHSKGDGLEVFVRGDVEVMKKAILLPEYRASLLYAIIKAGSVENLLSYEVQMLGNTSVKVIKDREFVDSLKNISAPLMKEGDDLGGVLV